MKLDRLKEIVDKIPVGMLLFLYLGYLSYDFYAFRTDSESPLNLKAREVSKAQETKKKLELKLKEANKFVQTLEIKKAEVKKLALELQSMKETLSEKSDVPAFMKMIITEAKKIGVTVVSLRPGGVVDRDFYSETTYLLSFRGVFMQVAGFLDRILNVAEIVRVENLMLKPVASSRDRFVILEGSVDIKTYKYRGSNADSVGHYESLTSIESNKPANPNNKTDLKFKGGT